jgi:dolichol-phosphate mannosyltransferase
MLSVIVPCFNEQEVVKQVHQRLSAVLAKITPAYEILYIDDGSRDNTAALLADIQRADEHVRVIGFSRNFGHQIAVSAGLEYAAGDAVVIIDADLQDPPELIETFVEKWHDGYDVVYGQRRDRAGETKFKLWTAHLFYRLINRLSDIEVPFDAGDFRLLDRRVVDSLRRMPERHRLLRAMVSWAGYRQIAVPYERAKRWGGKTKYPLRRMIELALDGIVSFSIVPLRVMLLIGLGVFILSGIGVIYALILRLLTSEWVPGWTLMFISLLAFGGLQFIFLGILGEYIGRIYSESKARPLFLVAQQLGFGGLSIPQETQKAAARNIHRLRA